MGGARWSSDSYVAYAAATEYRSAPRQEVFKQTMIAASLDPSKIILRESCDSEANPNSTPIILALDVTGSMGEYAELIAKTELPKLMNGLLEQQPISDPHLMFMGIDDVHAYSRAPLQVSQFEADIRIIEQLRDIFLVCGGGGNDSESYDLAWIFGGLKTQIDSHFKRGKKGYLFTFGDEAAPYQTVTKAQLQEVFGQQANDMPGPLMPSQSLALAQKQYNVFHVVIEQGSFCRHSSAKVKSTWTEMLGPNVLFLKDANLLSELVIATLQVAEGADINDVIAKSSNPAMFKYAFTNALKTL